MYADINGDGKVDGGKGTLADPGDQRIIGNSTPRYNLDWFWMLLIKDLMFLSSFRE